MAGLFDIASSGIQAYRSALSVTGQNIANINTEGYRRREVSLEEVTASQGGILTKATNTGLGVRLEDISRSFDVFLAGRVRQTGAEFASADAYLVAMEELERSLLPGGKDLGFFLNDFFGGLAGIGQSPADRAPRLEVLEQGRSLAGAFSQVSDTLGYLKDAVFGQAQQSVSEFNALVSELSATQARVLSSGQSGAASNAVLDERDRLIKEISELAGVTVEYQPREDVVIRLGKTGAGPVILQGFDAEPLSVREVDGRVAIFTGSGQSIRETRLVVSGRLAGLTEAYDALDSTLGTLDALAAQVAADMNAVHAGGLTLDGQRGAAMFTADASVLTEDPTNLGNFTASLIAPDLLGSAPVEIDLVFDGDAGVWRGYDATGAQVATGTDIIRYGEATINVTGTPADGDSLNLKFSVGQAGNMRFLLERPDDFAAAGLSLASADAGNLSSAKVSVSLEGRPETTGFSTIDELLPNDGTAMSAVRFLQEGVVGVIPAGATAVDLFSLGLQPSVSFTLSSDDLDDLYAGSATLSLTIDDTSKTFSLSALADLYDADAEFSLADVALLLNTGALLSGDTASSFADLGLHAAAQDGLLTISASATEISGSMLGLTTTLVGLSSTGNSVASDIQIFTREGRHIAGSPMSSTDLARLISIENGFLSGAEYRADYLNAANGVGYLGMGVDQAIPAGDYVVRFGVDALSTTELQLRLGTETMSAITLPSDASAADIAALLNAQVSDTGVHAVAQTRVELALVTGDGPVRFDLTSEGGETATIEAVLVEGDLASLRNAINERAADTGITAVLTPDRTRVILEQASGQRITISGLTSLDTTPSTVELDAWAVNDRYSALSQTAVTVGTSSSSVEFNGHVRVFAAASFDLLDDQGDTFTGANDPFSGGVMSRSYSDAGRVQTLSFGVIEGIDTNEASVDGSAASSAEAYYTLDLGSPFSAVTANSASLVSPTSAAVAAVLAQDLRAQGPVPSLSGGDLGDVGLPADGTSITVALGSQLYTITMVSGEPVVSGPEANRLIVGFDETPILSISAADGVVSGQTLRLVGGDLTEFGLEDDGVEIRLAGRVVVDAWEGSQTFTLRIDETDYTIQVDEDGVAETDLPDGVTVGVSADGLFVITLDNTLAGETVRIVPGGDEAALGLLVVEAEMLVTSSGMVVTSLGDEAMQLDGDAHSLAGQRITLTNLPEEELIIVMTGTGGARNLAARYDIGPENGMPDVPPPLELRVIDATIGRVELFDRETGHTVATRTLGSDGLVSAAGYRFQVTGAVATDDSFYLDPNIDGVGDGRNLEALLDLQKLDADTGRGGFQDIYRALVTDVGGRVRSGTLATQSTMALRDAAAEIESSYAGVNMDVEAARLMEQQQVYQALSRVLSTSNDLLDTLLQSF